MRTCPIVDIILKLERSTDQTFSGLTSDQQCIEELSFGRTDERGVILELNHCHGTVVFFDLTTFQTLLTVIFLDLFDYFSFSSFYD